jgi:four helix bundle protein
MRDHRSLVCWQLARSVTQGVFRISVRYWSPAAAAAFTQLQRAALSVQLNLAEGYVWRPGLKWVHHVRIAYGSAVESTDILDLLLDLKAVPAAALLPLIGESRRTQALVLGLLKSAQKSADGR